MKVFTDCKYYIGEKPCKFKIACEKSCPYYEPIDKVILIIKLGALGDVIRTTPVLRKLKKKFHNSYILWLTRDNALPLLKNDFVNKVLPLNWQSVEYLKSITFDYLFCFDKDDVAIALSRSLKAKVKRGFIANDLGKLDVTDENSLYALRLGIDDELKFKKNRKTYQEIIFEQIGEKFEGEEYVLPYIEKNKYFLKKWNIKPYEKIIGINIGCGEKFPTKDWGKEKYAALIELLLKNNYRPLILAGPDDEKTYSFLWEKYKNSNVIFSGVNNSLPEYMSIIKIANVIVTSDTLTLHLAIGLKVKNISLFGPTAPWEIETYNTGVKIFKSLPCAPCYKKYCESHECMKIITTQEVFEKIKKIIEEKN